LSEAYQFRFEHLGHDGDPQLLGTTTHLSVVDEAGNMVSLTNTLLERFGSRVMLPGTGIMMNNGIMWFDPRPGRPNSLAPGRRPLSNMCPVIATREGAGWFALGASGGRRIVPAVFQLTSFLIDFGLDLDAAYGTPRIDASGGEAVFVDRRLPCDVIQALGARMAVTETEHTVHPKMFANPQTVLRAGGRNSAAVTIHSPTAAVAVAGEA
jgi:gamma-glutamyltranspeptidase / glutathione hydrolase